jgi:hypothetical protein
MQRLRATGALAWNSVRKFRSVPILAAVALCFAPEILAQSHSTYLRWVPSSSAAGNPSLAYNVYRAGSCAGTFAKINAAPVTATVYLDNQPPPGTYCYRVTAVLNGVESTPSNDAMATILPLPALTSASLNPASPPASAKAACSHQGDLVDWIRCVAAKARARIAPPLPVR